MYTSIALIRVSHFEISPDSLWILLRVHSAFHLSPGALESETK